ncbi:MAG: DUF4838 domain-containing protein [Angelakisella sp.]
MLLSAPVRAEVTRKLHHLVAPSVILDFAEAELLRYLEQIFGASGSSASSLPVLFTDELSDTTPLRFDGYRITVLSGSVTIAAAQERGMLYGVYGLLRMLGCSFVFPGAERERIPRLTHCTLPEGVTEQSPWIEFRGLCLYDTTAKTLPETLDAVDWMAKSSYNMLLTSIHRKDDTIGEVHAILWDEIGDELFPQLQKRGIAVEMSEHSTDYFFPREKLFAQHPDWFALIDGKRTAGQICYANADAVQAYAHSYAEFAKKNHQLQWLGVWPLDGGDYCQCAACRDPLTVLRSSMAVAAAVQQVRPDLLVEHLAYTPQSFTRPEQPLPKNMTVLVCDANDHTAYEWGQRTKDGGGAFYFDYRTGDHYRFCANLWINPFYCRELVNTFAAYGYRGVVSLYLPVTSWWQSSLNYYYLARFYANPTATVEEVTHTLATELFGAAQAAQMTDILMKIFTELQDQTLWSRQPFAPRHLKSDSAQRSTALDAAHHARFQEVTEQLERQLDSVAFAESSPAAQSLDYLRAYVRLQELFYRCVDQYDNSRDTPARAEPFFEELAALAERYGAVFIHEEYARWRIAGRDSLLK